MSEGQHDLAAEFPAYKEEIHKLKLGNSRFRAQFDRYHEVSKLIHRAEQRVDTITEIAEEALRKERLQLKDDLYAMLVTEAQQRERQEKSPS